MSVNNIAKVRVLYSDTDAMGVVYHTNYIKWFELGRNELMRQLGVPYTELCSVGLNLPLIKVSCEYMKFATYDQLLTVETEFAYIKKATVRYNSRIWDENKENLIAEGYTIHACTNNEGKIRRIPKLLLELINKFNIRGE
ncbi:4-hydroxybenzoyl-CoA thioesterase family active site protein [Smithella sp. ME-1]|uniref:4-hydroxybenzoyl-coa thioesterase family active site n=1 Tax=hydrocarbon metagenome TaxID=938273 RepID=A0A0W8FUB0_9ZZZZ|nr:4-hydroxybenzoyl-CoA thioesterase family active site protein [Smithella sp. ME-1]